MVLFGTSIRISCIASVDQINRKPQLIYNSSEDPNDITPSVNASIDKALASKVMQFDAYLTCILQNIWEAKPLYGPV